MAVNVYSSLWGNEGVPAVLCRVMEHPVVCFDKLIKHKNSENGGDCAFMDI